MPSNSSVNLLSAGVQSLPHIANPNIFANRHNGDYLTTCVGIDPSLANMDLPGDEIFDMLVLDQAENPAPIPNLDVPASNASVSFPIPSTVRLDPSDKVWSAADQEENVRRLLQTSSLGEYPFPTLTGSSKIVKAVAAETDSSAAIPKRRRRRRKPPLTEAQKEEKQRRFLERNRLAASKCRAKRKTEIERLEDSRKEMGRMNEMLRARLGELWAEVQRLRAAVSAHASCEHADVNEWDEHKADSAATDEFCSSMAAAGRLGGFPSDQTGLEVKDELNMDGLLDLESELDFEKASDNVGDLEQVDNSTTLLDLENVISLDNGQDLEAGGSRKSSIESSSFSHIFSEDGGPNRSSISASPLSPPEPTNANKGGASTATRSLRVKK